MEFVDIFYCPNCKYVRTILDEPFKNKGPYFVCTKCKNNFTKRKFGNLKRIKFNKENLEKIDKHIERLNNRGYSPNKIAEELFLKSRFVYNRLIKNDINVNIYKYRYSSYSKLIIEDIDIFLHKTFKQYKCKSKISVEKLIIQLINSGFSKKLIYTLVNSDYFIILDDKKYMKVNKTPMLQIKIIDESLKDYDFDVLVDLAEEYDDRVELIFDGFIKLSSTFINNIISYNKIQSITKESKITRDTVFKLTKEKYIQVDEKKLLYFLKENKIKPSYLKEYDMYKLLKLKFSNLM